MWLVNVKTLELKEFPDDKTPPYAILSHTWGPDYEELTFRDVKDGNVNKTGVGSVKLHGCCRQAEKDGIGYAWVDTCCIDKTNLAELSEAINSMFRWYKRASVCYVYLSDVPDNDSPQERGSKFRQSRWFGRGWTLQELLAPSDLQFYSSEWRKLGTKKSLRAIIRGITGIPHQVLQGITEIHAASVAQRMSWAARRDTKRKEDLAYCLLGIFGVSMPMIYGEGGDQAFFRLQEQIMKTTRDDSILAWGLGDQEPPTSDPGQATSGRILAAGPSDFANSGHIVFHEPSASSLHPLDVSGGYLRIHLPLLIMSADGAIGLLSCGPQHDEQQVVGIPLAKITPGSSDLYVRPNGCHSMLRPKAASGASPKLIHIRNDSRAKPPLDANRQVWLYDDEEFSQVGLSLIEVLPRSCWDNEGAQITPTVESDGATHRTLARFRHSKEGSPDFMMVLEFKQQSTCTEARCCLMICTRKTSLELLFGKLQHLAQKACGKGSASNGPLNLRAILEHDAHQPMFHIRLEAMPHPPDTTIDATAEFQQLHLMLELARTLGEGSAEIHRLTAKQADVQKRWDELWNTDGGRTGVQTPLRWAAENGHVDTAKLLLDSGADPAIADNDGWTPLIAASSKGHVDVVRLLLSASGVDINSRDKDGRTAFQRAAEGGHQAILRLLSQKGTRILGKHDGPVYSIAFSPDGKTLASASEDKTVRLWKTANGALRQTLPEHSDWVRGVAFSPDGGMLVSVSDDRTVRLWYAASGALRQTLEGHNHIVAAVAFSPDGKTFASGSWDRTVWLWDAASGALRRTLQGHTDQVYGVAFSPDGAILASGSRDKTIRLWDAASGALRRTLRGHNNNVAAVAFSPDGKTLASGSRDTTIRLWDAASGSLRQTLQGYNNTVAVAFSPDGKTLASASGDKTVRLWDAASGALRQTFQHNSVVTAVAFSPDGTILASGSFDRTIRLWDMITVDI